MTVLTAERSVTDRWEAIHGRDYPLVIERRTLPFAAETILSLLSDPEFELRIAGPLDDMPRQLGALPDALRFDMLLLAQRFAELMKVNALRIRLETIKTNACRKVHADYTDVRLISTYSGEGTDYAPDPDRPDHLLRLEAGWIGLFKGRAFHPDHPPALHRSPPIAGIGARRLLLVIDTPLKSEAPVSIPG